MKKEKFGRYYSLRAYVVACVFVIMMWAGFLTGAIMIILHYFFGQMSRFQAPLVIVAVCLLVSVFMGTCVSAFVGNRMVRPLKKMIAAMKKVEKGDLSVSVDASSTEGEINELVESFNRMVQELNSIEMFRENFINSFSHEFKTPIVSIQGFAKQLKKDNISEEKKQEYIDIIIDESKRLTNLSSNILMLTKLENQTIITDKDKFSLDEQIRDSILLLEKQWSAKDIEFDIDMDSITYVTNEDMMSQVWVNILSNAIKFSPTKSKISITLHETENEIRVQIKDNGIGMNEETINHIFERFYQGDKAHSQEGNGLGLPLVKRIVELCDGNIRVESQYGIGTEFIVTLPIIE